MEQAQMNRAGSQQPPDERNDNVDQRESTLQTNQEKLEQPPENHDNNEDPNSPPAQINQEGPQLPPITFIMTPIIAEVLYYPGGRDNMVNQPGPRVSLIRDDNDANGSPGSAKIDAKPDSSNTEPNQQAHDTNQQAQDTNQQAQNTNDLAEEILSEICDNNSPFQYRNILLFGFTLALSGAFGLAFVLTAFDVEQRCLIPECEHIIDTKYDQPWVEYAIPYRNGKPEPCVRYKLEDFVIYLENQTCSAEYFSLDLIDNECADYVYKSDGKSIKHEFKFECEKTAAALSFVGTANHVSRALCLSLMGHFSDRYGRRTILIISVMGSTILAYIRSFAPDYVTFLIFEALEAGIGSCIYSTSFILAMEWVRSEHRVAFSTIITAMYPIGPIFLGLVAHFSGDFRTLLRIVYAPGILILGYIWIAPESLRWLLANSKMAEIRATLKTVESMNQTEVSDDTWSKIETHCNNNGDANRRKELTGIMAVFPRINQAPILWCRLLCCIFLWVTLSMVSYGISIASTSVLGDRYTSFIIIAVAGFPAMLMCYYGITIFGRPITLAFSLLSGGTFIISSKVVSNEITSVVLYFLAKCCITSAYTTLYLYQTEIWPTPIRNSVFGICSAFGRIGSIVSTFTPLLIQYSPLLPFIIFGMMCALGALAVLALPENANKPLPDDFEQVDLKSRGNSVYARDSIGGLCIAGAPVNT